MMIRDIHIHSHSIREKYDEAMDLGGYPYVHTNPHGAKTGKFPNCWTSCASTELVRRRSLSPSCLEMQKCKIAFTRLGFVWHVPLMPPDTWTRNVQTSSAEVALGIWKSHSKPGDRCKFAWSLLQGNLEHCSYSIFIFLISALSSVISSCSFSTVVLF